MTYRYFHCSAELCFRFFLNIFAQHSVAYSISGRSHCIRNTSLRYFFLACIALSIARHSHSTHPYTHAHIVTLAAFMLGRSPFPSIRSIYSSYLAPMIFNFLSGRTNEPSDATPLPLSFFPDPPWIPPPPFPTTPKKRTNFLLGEFSLPSPFSCIRKEG